MEEKQYKAYEYNTMMKTAYLWLPFFSIVITICNFFEKLRYFLILTVVSATFWGIIERMKKKAIVLKFSQESITIAKTEIDLSNIENYYTCLPLNKLFMLRIKTKREKKVLYIEKEYRKEIENLMTNYQISFRKTTNDIWLKYSHLLIAFCGLFISLLIYTVYQHLKYSVL